MFFAKIGHLVVCTVVKAMPGAVAYLTLIQPEGPLALLPHADADQPLKIGDTVFAVVARVAAPYQSLSQKNVHYVRRIVEMVLSPLRQDGHLAVRRVAYQRDLPFCKVAVCLSHPDVIKQALSLIPETRAYLTPRVTLIPYDQDQETYIKHALIPAPSRAIQGMEFGPERKTVWLTVEPSFRGKVLGPRGANLRLTESLTGKRLQLTGMAPAPKADRITPMLVLASG